VTYDTGGAREVCWNGETGFVVRPGDIQSVVRHAQQLSRDPMLCKAMGERGREFVRKAFSIEKLVDDQYELYQRLRNGFLDSSNP
jgi:L-malate glycosyltransferase